MTVLSKTGLKCVQSSGISVWMNIFLLMGALFYSSCLLAHNDNGYYHDSGNLPARADWMSRLDNRMKIRDVTLPGTHDSGSRYGGDIVQTQSLTVRQQLDAGVRYLDIRLRHIDDAFTIHHGPVYQKMNFDGVLTQVGSFLKDHPSEVVLMRVKEEHTEKNCHRTFNDTFRDYYQRYGDLIWHPDQKADMSTVNPTLGELRGRLVFLQNLTSSEYSPYGMAYSGFDIQDDYQVATNWDLYGKWEKVKAQINAADAAKGTAHKGYINHLTASTGSFPYFIASGHSSHGTGAPRLSTGLTTPGWKDRYPDFPRVSCFIGICTIAFEGTNTLTKDYLNNNAIRYAGIVIADFPGSGLVDAIIACNFR